MLASILLPDRDCKTCFDPKNKQGPQKRREWGCDEPTPYAARFKDETWDRCPRRPYLEQPAWFNVIFEAYRWYQRNHFPDEGQWLDQSAKLVRYIEIIEAALAEGEKAKSEVEASRAKARAGQGVKKTPSPRSMPPPPPRR